MINFKRTISAAAFMLLAAMALATAVNTDYTYYMTAGSGNPDSVYVQSGGGNVISVLVVNPIAAKTYTLRKADASTGGIVWSKKYPATVNTAPSSDVVNFKLASGISYYLTSDDLTASASVILYSRN